MLIIIVNYCTAAQVIEAARSIEPERNNVADLRVIVVDNASPDDSAARLASAIVNHAWSDWVRLVTAESNDGFAAGNNLGIQAAMQDGPLPEHVLFLNPDTRVCPGMCEAMLRFMEHHPTAGICGPSILDEQLHFQAGPKRDPSPLGELESTARLGPVTRLLHRQRVAMRAGDEPTRCDWVSGAAILLRADVLEAIGNWDESYFLYYEEIDLCNRARAGGWSVWHVPQARVMHIEGASTGISDQKQRRTQHWYDSRRQYFVRQYGWTGLACADIAWGMGRILQLGRRAIRLRRGEASTPNWFAWDLLAGDCKALLTQRKDNGPSIATNMTRDPTQYSPLPHQQSGIRTAREG